MIFEQIKLQTGELEQLKFFYGHVLGLEIFEDTAEQFSVRIGWTKLRFEQAAEGNPFYHFAANIPENRMVQAKEWLSSRASLQMEDGENEVFFTSWNAHSVYFEDPAGNIVEFIARHNLKNASEEAFSSRSLLCVSEIGIVRDEVIPFVRELNRQGFPNWKEDSEGLTPVGDELGLFIVVRDQRIWFFSRRPASRFPVNVKVEGRAEWMEL
ncbi:VOC family protein [Fontibacillus sp. BL9]|uniref:VOC family protein n=1 Tax=Fontibacillus sp. BL9 TaxID=3389971 RepID=UPI0039789EE4